MTLSKTTILNEVNQRTGRSWTDSEILLAFKGVLHDIAKEGLLISRSSTTCAVGTANYAVTNGKKLIWAQIYNTDTEKWSEPLEIITEGEYREAIGGDLSNSLPAKATFYNGSIYLTPAPSSTDYDLYYKVLIGHADDVDTISFDDEFREGIIEGVCFKSYELAGLQDKPKAIYHKQLYDEQKMKYAEQQGRSQPSRVVYNDF